MSGFAPTQVLHVALGLVEFHEVLLGLLLKFVLVQIDNELIVSRFLLNFGILCHIKY